MTDLIQCSKLLMVDLALAGYTTSFNYPNIYAFLTKTDMNGNILWNKQIAYANFIYGFSMDLTNDGGYIITGSIDEGNYYTDVCLIKADSIGNIMWTKKYGNDSLDDAGYSVKQISDGGFIITGNVFIYLGPGQQAGHIYLLKTDINGNLLWEKKFQACCTEGGQAAIETNDKGFIITGKSGSFVPRNAYLIKTDSIGVVRWCKHYSNGFPNANEYPMSVKQTSDNGYIFCGLAGGSVSDVAYLVKTDSMGNTPCNDYNYTFHDSIYTSAGSSVNCIITTPTFNIFNQPIIAGNLNCNDDVLCSTGTEIIELRNFLEITISPNPTTDFITVHYNLSSTKQTTLSLFNLYGQPLLSKEELLRTSSQEIKIDMRNFPGGIYFVKVSVGEKEEVKKVVKY